MLFCSLSLRHSHKCTYILYIGYSIVKFFYCRSFYVYNNITCFSNYFYVIILVNVIYTYIFSINIPEISDPPKILATFVIFFQRESLFLEKKLAFFFFAFFYFSFRNVSVMVKVWNRLCQVITTTNNRF